MTVTYPLGYQRQLVTMDKLIQVHGPRMHPEYKRRVFPWIESKGGLIGIGDGWRECPSNVSDASRRCESFHQNQPFVSGIVGYCALDLVARNGTNKHRSPTWAETADAVDYGLHTFIGEETPNPGDDEPWHVQPIEIRGWSTWVRAGRHDPRPNFPLPGGTTMAERLERRPKDEPRLYDSRLPIPNPLTSQERLLPITGLPATVVGVLANVAVIEPNAAGYLVVWDAGAPPKDKSTLNFGAQQTIAIETTIWLDPATDTFKVALGGTPGVTANLKIDVVGWWHS